MAIGGKIEANVRYKLYLKTKRGRLSNSTTFSRDDGWDEWKLVKVIEKNRR